jgi:hypothetical protein
MRALVGAVILAQALGGCATTVRRLDGEIATPAGPSRSSCEREDWLVIAPTHAEPALTKKRSDPRDDGFALYRVGETTPSPLPPLRDALSETPEETRLFDERAERVRTHDLKQAISAGMGVLGIIGIGVGTFLFVDSFGTRRVVESGVPGEEQTVDGTKATVGGLLIAGGFGLGIGGLVLNPGQIERSDAEAARYTFLPPRDDPKLVVRMVERHNLAVRERCTLGTAGVQAASEEPAARSP